ncbi:destabilase-related [Holotrichia oblita]|uniref:Destabilase-related n=1 Tax=Holotrichia oblita TaxID=644536 RepID=A0ACB9SLQ5_HOLOL|nr:destabilase-related [Holotrichia oblita]
MYNGMKLILAYLTIVLLFQHSEQLRNLLNTDFHECVKCVCHATTGCYQRTNCANYSMSYQYWQKAEHPTLSDSDPNNHRSYNKFINAYLKYYISDSEQLENLLNTDLHTCIKCLCHARTGCYRRRNCASYSISEAYWKKAGYPSLPGDNPNSSQSYNRCMQDENCIVNTIVGYTRNFNNLDCNCDGKYDCQDMLKLHLFGEQCGSRMDNDQVRRFNNCASTNHLASMVSNELCQVEAQ